MSIITYHEWAEKVGYIQNKDWTNLPDARKMLDRRDVLLDKEVKNGLTPEEKQELEAYDGYWMYAFEYGFNTIDEVIAFKTGYFQDVFKNVLNERTPKIIEMYKVDELKKLNELSKYISDKNWKTK